MSYITEEEMRDLRINKMIVHVVQHKDDNAFVPEEEIEVQQEEFFKSRIQSEAGDSVHSFNDESELKRILERMARNEITFAVGGQDLSKRFWEFHVSQSTRGAFFVLELRSAVPDTVLYALIKYDYREAVELTDQDGKSILRAIIHAFVKERRAVQKFCLARVRTGIADLAVCASDRMKEAPDLTDYFERYLDVRRERTNAELSGRLNEALRETLEEIKDQIPNHDVGAAVARAKIALQGRATVSNADVIDAILHSADRPENEDVRAHIEAVARKKLQRQKLQDVEFRPDRNILRVQPRLLVRTVEQVRLEFPREELGHSVFREDGDNGVVFTIRTQRLLEDGTLPIKTR